MHLEPTNLIDRLTLGATPGWQNELTAHGMDNWINTQFNPKEELPELVDRLNHFDTLSLDPEALFARFWPPKQVRKDPEARKQYRHKARKVYFEAASARLLRGVYSPWQLRELLVDFWFNHFNVFARKGPCAIWVGSFEQQAIRPNVFGHFSDLLAATARHPAMLFYLDNARNTNPSIGRWRKKHSGLNENYARELMELHTLGLHYTQSDVSAVTHLLTGWGLSKQGGFAFHPRRHDASPQIVLGQRFSGEEESIESLLDFLANHPDTAHHISRKMAQYFVADEPDASLVEHMRARFLATQGNLKAVTQAMIEHPAFAIAAQQRNKFRTPYRYVLASLRASGRTLNNTRPLIGTLGNMGQGLYRCLTPDGWANTQSEWLSPDALNKRLDFAVALGGGWLRLESEKHAPHQHPVAVNVNKLMDAVGEIVPKASLEATIRAPERLRAAMILGCPAMQYC